MRKPVEERWNSENLDFVVGVPWRINEEDPEVDGEKLKCKQLSEEEKRELQEEVEHRKMIPRRFAIRLQDIERHGPSESCGGCRALVRRKPGQVHSAPCRNRFEALMKATIE